jgi:hypothetical protein
MNATGTDIAPKTSTGAVDQNRGNAPANSQGLALVTQAFGDGSLIARGRVCDVYAGSYYCNVSIPNQKRNLPCIWLSHAINHWGGVADVGAPAIGTTVAVFTPPNGKYGIILGSMPEISDSKLNSISLDNFPDGGFRNRSSEECHNPADFAKRKTLAGDYGMPNDTIPGDRSWQNELGVMLGVFRSFATLKASDLAKIETFLIDDLVRITAQNLQEYTSLGEYTIRNDNGRLDMEWLASTVLNESLDQAGANGQVTGMGYQEVSDPDYDSKRPIPTNNVDPISYEAGRWRLKTFVGYLGDFLQMFLIRPSSVVGDGELGKESKDEIGLFQDYLDLSGHRISRSVIGHGMHKSHQIAVPVKKYDFDDPEGDTSAPDQSEKKDFKFDESGVKGLVGMSCQLRDYFAWIYNSYAPTNRMDYKKDWIIPDENSCPRPNSSSITSPQNNGFFRQFPSKVSLQVAEKNTKSIWSGEAWSHILPDGSYSMRDTWGSSIDTRAGHMWLSCSNDLTLFAGRNVVILAGGDIIQRAKKNIECSTSDGQIRIKAQTDILAHSEKGGIQMTALSEGYSGDIKKKGSEYGTRGITFKTGSGVSMFAKSLEVGMDNTILFGKGEKGTAPSINFELSSWLQKTQSSCVYRFGDSDYFSASQSGIMTSGTIRGEKGIQVLENVYASGSITADGNIISAGSMAALGGGLSVNGYISAVGSISGKTVSPSGGGSADTSELASALNTSRGGFFGKLKRSWKKISEIMSPSFSDEAWSGVQFPYKLDEVSKIKFTFRSEEEYKTKTGAAFFESFWQRELTGGTVAWEEQAVAETYPYPGKSHYTTPGTYWTYKEGNVEQGGGYKTRQTQSEKGGSFSAKSLNELKVLS